MNVKLLFWCCFLLLLAVAGLAYSLGLGGTFLLDDYGTLPPLAQWGAVDSLVKLQQFIGGGFTGPTGRPVSLLSFVLHGGVWPTEARNFLLFNVACHLLTGIVLFVLLRKLVRWSGQEPHFCWLPLLATALWLLHPFHVSTVLYVVQRMTLLSALFSLLALLAYLAGRLYLQQQRVGRGLTCMVAGAVSAVLALCSKENAVLLPLQFLLLELFLWWSAKRPSQTGASYPLLARPTRLSQAVIVAAVVIPSLIVIGYLLSPLLKNIWLFIDEGRELGTRRDFTLFERLATQQRVVGDYLMNLLVPRAQTAGLFHDGYPLSRNLLEPPSGLLWLLGHIGLVGGALCLRRRLPWLAFGVLWFYVGHWVESGTIMLEIKFEHRNYLPSIGLAVAVAALLLKLPLAGRLKGTIALLISALLLVLLALRASLWGQPEKAALVWAQENPNSTRALEHAAMVHSAGPGGTQIVENALRQAVERSGGNGITLLKYYSYMCPRAKQIDIDVNSVAQRLQTDPLDWQASGVFEEILNHMISGECNLSLSDYQQLISAANSNPYYRRTRYPLIFRGLEARSELALGSPERAVSLYREQNYQKVPLGMIMTQALWMASYQQQAPAAAHLRRGIEAGIGADEYLREQAEDMLQKIERDIPINKESERQE